MVGSHELNLLGYLAAEYVDLNLAREVSEEVLKVNVYFKLTEHLHEYRISLVIN